MLYGGDAEIQVLAQTASASSHLPVPNDCWIGTIRSVPGKAKKEITVKAFSHDQIPDAISGNMLLLFAF